MRLIKLWTNRLWEAMNSRRVVVIILAFIGLGCICASFGYILRGWKLQQEIAFWQGVATAPEPENCALCDFKEGEVRYAPVLLDLSTGAIGEMRINKSNESGEVLDDVSTQHDGIFGFVVCAGLTGWRDTATNTLQVTLSEENKLMNASLFCHECRAILANTSSKGYVILDWFDADVIKAYKIEEGTFAIRDYEVSILQTDKLGELTICVRR